MSPNSSAFNSTTSVSSRNSALDTWITLTSAYNRSYGYVDLVVCAVGIVLNLMNIGVLLKRRMRKKNMNLILLAMAFADVFLMIFDIPIIYYTFGPISTPMYHKAEAVFFIIIRTLQVTAHVISLLLAVVISIFRYIGVCWPFKAPYLCSITRAKIAIATVYLVGFLSCAPQFVVYGIKEKSVNNRTELHLYLKRGFHSPIMWIYGSMGKIIPSILLLVLTARTLWTLHQETAATSRPGMQLTPDSEDTQASRGKQFRKITKMLVVIVLLYIIVELPQGIVCLAASLNENIMMVVYIRIIHMFDLAVLVNSSINFIVYSMMNQDFRKTLCEIVFECSSRKHHRRLSKLSWSNKSTTYATELTDQDETLM